MAKQKTSIVKLQASKKNHLVDSENEFAAEFGEGLYGGQAREAFKQQHANKSNKTSK